MCSLLFIFREDVTQTSRTKVAMHRSTLETKLRLFQVVKLSSRNLNIVLCNGSIHRSNVAHRCIGMADIWGSKAWKAWCSELKQNKRAPKRAKLPEQQWKQLRSSYPGRLKGLALQYARHRSGSEAGVIRLHFAS